jgi:hypothetical protein
MTMFYNFAIFSGLALLGWEQHNVEIEGSHHKVWVHNSGVVVYNQGVNHD